ncbi:hypothetical protein ACIBHX_42810 [Nonomuraea sp. NPDC050536]|uniref:hypothetical protein n=1 Tax=Nonomuraea sp. NPDC050536 TaxID=3364366 RepID=UPI0037CCA2B3
MMRRLAAGLAATALGVTALATAAAPAMADPDPDYDGGSTSLSLDVNPEPAWRGRPLDIDGRLSVKCEDDYIDGFTQVLHSDWCKKDESWHRLGGKRIVLLFRPDGSGRWEYVETVRTDGSGSFHDRVPAYTSGTWRAIFEGSHYLRSAEATDWVKVIGHHH